MSRCLFRLWALPIGLTLGMIASPAWAQVAPPHSTQPPSYDATQLFPNAPLNGAANAYQHPYSDFGDLHGLATACGPNEGVFVQYDHLYWSISAPDVAVVGDLASERFVSEIGGVTFFHANDVNTSFLESA